MMDPNIATHPTIPLMTLGDSWSYVFIVVNYTYIVYSIIYLIDVNLHSI